MDEPRSGLSASGWRTALVDSRRHESREGPGVIDPVLLTGDPDLLDQVLAVAAVAGVEPQVVSDAGAMRAVWGSTSMVIVGVDQAAQLAGLVLPRRPGVFVVGGDAALDEVCSWSAPLAAAVVVLPSGAHRLTTAMADSAGGSVGSGRVVAVVGGSGGVGTSTVAVALGLAGVQRGARTMLVDADPAGGASTC